MPLQNFTDFLPPTVKAAWLNGVDVLKFTIFGDATTKPAARTALELDPQLVAFGVDAGAANAAVVTLVGPVTNYVRAVGSKVNFIAAATNTGATTLNVNGTGAAAILNQLGNPLTGGELSQPLTVQWTGAAWRIVAGSIPVANARQAIETSLGVIPVNYNFLPGYVLRYGNNTTPGVTDMTTAIQTAVNVANAWGVGGGVWFSNQQSYLTTSAIIFPAASIKINVYGDGAFMLCNHIGDGFQWIATNENFSGHSISDLTIQGPNPLAFFPTVWTSTGSGINMNRDTTTNVVTAYNCRLRNVTIQGFKYGLNLQCVIGLSATDCYIWFNEEGVRFDGGQTNANCFTNCHIRYNRNRGIWSTGRSGGALTSVTNNKFIGCLIESNVQDPFTSGGSPPNNNTGIYLNNSYDFVFVGCYSENHSASIYLSNGSKGNKFIAHRIASGLGRLDVVWLSGAGIYNNEFDIHADSLSFTEVNVRSDNSDQLFNTFKGNGLNFVETGEVLAKLDYTDMKPSMAFPTTRNYGLIRMPSQGYSANVDSSVVSGIGTGAATLLSRGFGEIAFGNGITGNTTITTITGLRPHSFLLLRGTQNTNQCNLSGTAFGLLQNINVNLTTGLQILLWIGGDGNPREVGRNFGTRAAYTVTNGSADRALNVTGDTLAQVAAVLGTLIDDLKAFGILS